jgi:hypothetical protein
MRMTPKAELISARLLRYTAEDHRADNGWLAKAAAKLLLEQAEEIERLKPALAGKADNSQRESDYGENHDRGQPPAISPLF